MKASFDDGARGDITVHDLSDAIHSFYQGPSRKLWSQYQPDNARICVAAAIHRGLISHAEAGDATVKALSSEIAFFREVNERAD